MSSDSPKVMLLNGPNLNLLGQREPQVYGSVSLDMIVARLQQQAQQSGLELSHFQSNHEGALVDEIHKCLAADGSKKVDYVIINPGAFTHTSVAIRDALLGVAVPFIEVHLSNVHAREAFRHHSYLSDKATGVICGLGANGYDFALQFVANKLAQTSLN